MIQAEDLRIGDLVRYGKDVITLTAVHANGSVCFADGKDQMYAEDVLLEPIPLTSEILTSNGWGAKQIGLHEFLIYNEDNEMFLEWSDIVNRYTYNDFFRSKNFKIVRYVHELQHILWAFGKDANLTI